MNFMPVYRGLTVGRFTAIRFIDRYDRVMPMVRAGVRLCKTLNYWADYFYTISIAFACRVAGVCCAALSGMGGCLMGFHLLKIIFTANDTGPDITSAIFVVATTGYRLSSSGPPLLEYLGEHYGLHVVQCCGCTGAGYSLRGYCRESKS